MTSTKYQLGDERNVYQQEQGRTEQSLRDRGRAAAEVGGDFPEGATDCSAAALTWTRTRCSASSPDSAS